MRTILTSIRRSSLLVVLLGVSFALAACGGGGGGGTAGVGSSPAVSTGVMTKGSVIVNGVRFTAAAGATIKVDDNPGRPEAELRDGMEVKVRGQINDDRVTGQFEKVEAEPEVRGAMGGKGLDDFTVLGHHVITDDRTVFENRAANGTTFTTINFAALVNGEKVEVHGGKDDLGNIHASRVERRQDVINDEVKGIATAFTPNVSITVDGTFTVSAVGATISPAGATITAGTTFVEVHLDAAGTTATRIDVEDVEDAEFEPAEGQEFEVEGFVSGFTAHPGTFKVGNETVQTTGSTRFERGVAGDLMNGVEVEAEGHKTGGVFVVDKIQFEDSVRIEANADAAGSANVLGKTVRTTSGTQFANLPTGVAGILAGDGLRIRGFVNKDGTSITATRVEKLGSPVAANQIILQGPVTASTPTTSFVIVGITVNVSGASEFRDVNDNLISATAFFNSLVTNRTVVKARGSFAAGTLTVGASGGNKVEIEEP